MCEIGSLITTLFQRENVQINSNIVSGILVIFLDIQLQICDTAPFPIIIWQQEYLKYPNDDKMS